MNIELNTVTLINTGESLKWDEADDAARKVYREFASSPDQAEELARLSFVALSQFDPEHLNRYLTRVTLDNLENRGYVKSLLGRISTRLELNALVAINMVVPSIDDGTVDGYLQEPFTNRIILPGLYLDYQHERSS